MSKEIKGKFYQEHEPTPDNPCEIKTILCNDIEIPVEFLKQTNVIVDGKKYIEIQQENQQYRQALLDIKEYLKDKEKEFIDEPYYNNYWEYEHILDIVNKALGSDNNE